MSSVHKNLTGADLHEPKGAETALSGQVYVSDGAGSGSWLDASSVLTNAVFTTGDAKLTYKASADTGWVLADDGTIGDGSSGATTRANADTAALFTLLYGLAVGLTVSGGRGASAVADYAAHKTIALPKALGRALVIGGAGSGLTSRQIGAIFGSETVTLVRSDLPNVSASVSVSISDPGHSHSYTVTSLPGGSGPQGGGSIAIALSTTSTGSSTTGISASGSFNMNGNVTQTTPSIMQPSTALNIMVKL